jgi:uncharacterized protein
MREGRIAVNYYCLSSTRSRLRAQEGEMAESNDALIANAKQFVDRLSKGEFAAAAAEFDAELAAQMDADKLSALWSGLQGQVGALQSSGEASAAPVSGLVMVTVPCQFERAPLEVRLAYGPDRKVKGLHFAPAGAK